MPSRALCVSLLITATLVGTAAIGHAQLWRPKAEITPLIESDAALSGSRVRLALKVVMPNGLHVQSNAPRDPSLVPTTLTIKQPASIDILELVYPPSRDFPQDGLDQPLAVFEDEFVLGVRVAVASSVPVGDLVIPARLRYQACDALMCYAPVTVDVSWTIRVVPAGTPITAQHRAVFDAIAFGKGAAPGLTASTAAPSMTARANGDGSLEGLDGFTVLATSGGYMNVDEFLVFIRNAERGVVAKKPFEGQGPLAILLVVFVGGLALNLTPCVLPMIPINLAIIGAGAQSGSRSRGFALGSAYGAAMAMVYGILGLVVILTASTFGTINASPWFNVGIAVIFVVLALAMFDVIPIDFSRYSSRFSGGGASRGSLGLALTMGAVAALLAGACVAPVVIQVVLFSSNLYATGTTVALALPFVLGLGMGLPWPLAGAGIASLPKPGMWMVRVKQAFGVLILGTAVYYGYLGYTLFASRWVDSAAVASSVQERIKAGWHASLADGLAAAQREQKPVLIDLWATWCKNCLTMDKTTFEDPAVMAALSNYVKIKFQAEDPEAQPAKTVMRRFHAVGLPTYVIVRPNGLGPKT